MDSNRRGSLIFPSSPVSVEPRHDSRLVTALIIVWNIVSSTCCIFCNKIVFASYGWGHGPALTTIHFLVTFLGLAVCAAAGLFTVKRLSLRSVFGLSASFSVFIVTMNLSLRYNSVGFYQLAKVVDTPFVYLIHSWLYNAHYSSQIKVSLTFVTLGVLIATSSGDLHFSPIGIVMAVCGIASCSFYQVWVGTKQTELKANSMQLLLFQAPIAALLLAVTLPLTEDLQDIVAFQYSANLVALIFLSALLGLCVNLSVYIMIGRTSPMLYNILGHAKFLFTLAGGFMFFGDPLTFRTLFGLFFTFSGLCGYSYFKLFPVPKEKLDANQDVL